jgi:predicted DNA-binding transcriptional regulator AlpA
MTFKLAEIIDNHERMNEIPPEAIPSILIQLASVQTALAVRLVRDPVVVNGRQEHVECDTLLTANEAAKLLSVSPRWLYRHWKQLPFSRRLSRKTLRFSQAGIRKWQQTRKA